eukprot:4620775-Pyramimonas_sp.AAC.1
MDLDHEMEELLERMPRETLDQGNFSTGRAAQFEIHGQGEGESDLPSEKESSHSIERIEERAQRHTSPGPSRHHNPLADGSDGLALGADLSDDETVDYAAVDALQQATLDSDDDVGDGSPGQGESSSAQPTLNSPE